MNLNHINKLNADEALEAFLKCCGSHSWARSMVAARPFFNDSDLLRAAETAFTSMEKSDWLDAFAAHPKIGDLNSLRQKYGNTRDWAQNEQSGVAGTSTEYQNKACRFPPQAGDQAATDRALDRHYWWCFRQVLASRCLSKTRER